jgi:hypothetical protein
VLKNDEKLEISEISEDDYNRIAGVLSKKTSIANHPDGTENKSKKLRKSTYKRNARHY